MIKTLTLSTLVVATIMIEPTYAVQSQIGIKFTPSRESHEIAQRTMARLATGHRITRADDTNPEEAVKAQMNAEEAANHSTQNLIQAQQQIERMGELMRASYLLNKIYHMYLTHFRDLASRAQESTLSSLEQSQMNDQYKDLKDKLLNLNIGHRLQTNDFLKELLSSPPQLRHVVTPEK